MDVDVIWSPQVSARFPELAICIGTINGVEIEKDNEPLRQLKKTVYGEVKAKYTVDALKDDLTVRAYRDFYWKLNIDPTKMRPSGEALLRRILHGSELPNISTVVDAYNLASVRTIVPISGFNKDLLNPPFQVRFVQSGEAFRGIGMTEPIALEENMLVLADAKQVLCVYPYRDSDFTKIAQKTRNVLVVGYGAPGISEQHLRNAVETTLEYMRQVARGEVETVKVFSCKPK
jgi:DNA/RNA-binding domain of Phe-tRNA-synthetase-like protein